jgi:hypothetical protein
MNNYKILFRKDLATEEEFQIAKKYFITSESRSSSRLCNSTIIARYSALPFYKELENDLMWNSSKLVNSYKQHQFIADMENWYEPLKKFTPETWFSVTEALDKSSNNEKSFVLKGCTNSKKFLWDTHMFAKNKMDLINVYCNLLDDTFISSQKIYIREFVKLNTFCISPHGLPIAEEYRVFVFKDKILSCGFYWSGYAEEFKDKIKKPGQESIDYVKDFVQPIIDIVKDHTSFYVLDVAKKENGDWILVEINDGQMSGLSENDPDFLYSNFKKEIDKIE